MSSQYYLQNFNVDWMLGIIGVAYNYQGNLEFAIGGSINCISGDQREN